MTQFKNKVQPFEAWQFKSDAPAPEWLTGRLFKSCTSDEHHLLTYDGLRKLNDGEWIRKGEFSVWTPSEVAERWEGVV